MTVDLRRSAGSVQVTRIRPLEQVYDDFTCIRNFAEIINKRQVGTDAEVVPDSSLPNIVVMPPPYTCCSIY